jgi:hypothetical protein
MAANEFNVDRVDSLHNIASAVPATSEKDQKRKKDNRRGRSPATKEEQAMIAAEEGVNVQEDQHVIDFEA